MINKLKIDGNDFSGTIKSARYRFRVLYVELTDSEKSLELMEYIRGGELYEQYELEFHNDEFKADGAAHIINMSTGGGILINQIFEDGPNW